LQVRQVFISLHVLHPFIAELQRVQAPRLEKYVEAQDVHIVALVQAIHCGIAELQRVQTPSLGK
jgi:hypothetical protein